MYFTTITSPHTQQHNNVEWVMGRVILALIPGIFAMIYLFGWGILINLVIATTTALVAEALALWLRRRPIIPTLKDLSAILTALLLALALPPTLPWWLTVLGVAFAILVAKQLYGGLGYNPFNPAMVGYIFLLISYPSPMHMWLPPLMLNNHPLSLIETLNMLFTGAMPGNVNLDAITAATPLDFMRTGLRMNHMLEELRLNPMWGDFGGRGWEWVSGCYALGGLWLIYTQVISWRIPFSLIAALTCIGSIFYLWNPQYHPFPVFHILSGGVMLGAFFIATDPVTACTTSKGQLFYGAAIGILIFIIRTWGGYPDAVAFAVLLLNMAVPIIDQYTQPRVFGASGSPFHVT